MIQTLKNSFRIFWKSKERNLFIILTVFLIIFSLLLFKYHLRNETSLNMLLNSILQFSSIFTALLISFIISKVFQIKQEKLGRINEIKLLSNKTTDFRRICKIIYDEYDFWNKTMRQKLDKKYKNISSFDLYSEIPESESKKILIDEYIRDTEKIGAGFFLGIRSILTNSKKSYQLELYDDYDHNITYSLELVEKWYSVDSANCFWYYLEHKWHNYKSAFDFEAIKKHEKEQIILLAKKINSKKYENASFSKDLLVSIGNDFQGNLFPRLYTLMYHNNQKIPKSLNFLIQILIITMLFGVFLPLLLSSIVINNFEIKVAISNLSIIILSQSIIYFVFSFRKILEHEIEITNEHI